uniref:Uncharacterized protein n=1 Tax=Physcomitrium patens TaxID=3218 RepID=A0A2K1J869_PHYPA|nr:hypothetical protein PHYPA_020827 [Physcomitrium patens]
MTLSLFNPRTGLVTYLAGDSNLLSQLCSDCNFQTHLICSALAVPALSLDQQ